MQLEFLGHFVSSPGKPDFPSQFESIPSRNRARNCGPGILRALPRLGLRRRALGSPMIDTVTEARMSEALTNPTELLAKPVREYLAALLDVQAVAEMFGCSTRHVYRLADRGAMPPPVRIGALVRWRRDSLSAWISAGCGPVRQNGITR
jgi:excisionase family DNA binding protein